jgi:glycosyltransferase involved in cell wall biosynthesis
MRVVHVTTVHNKHDNRIYYKECLSLAASGYDVSLIAPKDERPLLEGVIKLYEIPKFKNRALRILVAPFFAFFYCIKIKAKIYHFHDPELLPLAYIMSLLGSKVVFDMHENVPFQIMTKPWLGPLQKRIILTVYQSIERLVLKRISVVYAESSYQKYYPYVSSCTTVLNMPDLQMLAGKKSGIKFNDRDFVISYVGGISSLRGIDTLVDAIELLNNKTELPQIKVKLIGTLQDAALSERLKRCDFVEYLGFLPATEAFEEIKSSRIAIALLKDIPNYRQSYSTKIFEYMAVGLPVIYSDFEIYDEIFSGVDVGWAISPDNPDLLSGLISSVILDSDLLQQKASNARAFALEKLNWSSEFNKITGLYESV